MGNRFIHKNLDTSFVNLSALIKYLRRRQFIGGINVALNGYHAEVRLGVDNSIRVFEHDEISGRESEGEEALQRLLIRAREPGGTISVVQTVHGENSQDNQQQSDYVIPESELPKTAAEAKPLEQMIPKPTNALPIQQNESVTKPEIKVLRKSNPSVPPADIANKHELSQPPILDRNREKPRLPSDSRMNRGLKPRDLQQASNENKVESNPALGSQRKEAEPNSKSTMPGFPFELANKFEKKAKEMNSTPEEWQTLLKLTVELLTVIDRSLATANLNFSNEFRKVCSEISDDYPFLNPTAGIFSYSSGTIEMHRQINPKTFIGGISEALRRILLKLARSSKYANTYNATSERLQKLIQNRAVIYEKHDVTMHVRRIVSP